MVHELLLRFLSSFLISFDAMQTSHSIKAILSVLFGLVLIWTGLGRGMEAAAYKPNALWFCFAVATLAIAAGYLFQLRITRTAITLAVIASLVIFAFYLGQFITKPESDANMRVGFVIVAAVAHFVSATFPSAKT